MASTRHLALMALMRDIEAPSATYRRTVRLAASLLSDTPQWDTAVEKGTTALDDIETAVRRWVAKHPDQTGLAEGFERHSCITVKCAACGYGYDETEYDHHFPTVGDAIDGAIGSGWDELKDGRVLCETHDEKHDELRNTVGVINDSEA